MLSDYLIKIIVFFLPTQLGLHFWPSFSRVAGIKIDYLSPTLYFLDLLLVLLIILNLKKLFQLLRKNLLYILICLVFISLNTVFSISPINTLFWWLRATLYLATFLILRIRKLKWEDIKNPLLFSSLYILFIQIAQLLTQSSLGGPFYLLGERAFSSSTPGLGRLNLFGLEVIRPLSTFSHANSLAGYFLVVFYLFSKKSPKTWYQLIPFLGILLSFSKSAIIYLAFILFHIRPEIIIPFSLILSLTQPFLQNYVTNWQPLSDRFFFYHYLKSTLLHNPLLGVGLGNFIPSLGSSLPGSFLTPSKLQPIHNLLYLFLSELGLLGTSLLFLTFLKKKLRQMISKPEILGLISLLLFTGTFDHYFWTLPQNKLIFLFALAIML